MNEFILMWLLNSLMTFGNVAAGMVGALTACLGVALFVGVMMSAVESKDWFLQAIWGYRKVIITTYIVLGMFGIFIPDKDDLYFILGGGAALYVASDQEVQQLPGNLAKAANEWLEGYYQSEEEVNQ